MTFAATKALVGYKDTALRGAVPVNDQGYLLLEGQWSCWRATTALALGSVASELNWPAWWRAGVARLPTGRIAALQFPTRPPRW